MIWVFGKRERVSFSKSLVVNRLDTMLNIFQCWPWHQLIKVAINEHGFDRFGPTNLDVCTKDAILWATLFCGGARFVDLDNGLQCIVREQAGLRILWTAYHTREARLSFWWAIENRHSLYIIVLIVQKATSVFRCYEFGLRLRLGLGLGLASLHIGGRSLTDTNVVAYGGRGASEPLLSKSEMTGMFSEQSKSPGSEFELALWQPETLCVLQRSNLC